MGISIRLGTRGDIDALVELYGVVCDDLEATVNYTGWKKDVYPARQDAEVGIAEETLFLAEENGEVVASMILSRRPEAAYAAANWQAVLDESQVLVIHTLAVRPGQRRRGTGRELLDFASRFGTVRGVRSLRLDVYEKNLPAIRLYESAGFQYIDTVSLGLEDVGLDWFRLYEKLL